MRKLRRRTVNSPIQGHTGNEWQSQDLKPCYLAPVSILSTITSIASPEERDGTSRERNAWGVFQTEGTASTKALRQEQTGARNRALLENSIGE